MDPLIITQLALTCANNILEIIKLRMQKETNEQFQAEVQQWLDFLKFFQGLAGKS